MIEKPFSLSLALFIFLTITLFAGFFQPAFWHPYQREFSDALSFVAGQGELPAGLSENEVEHMEDVRGLVFKTRIVWVLLGLFGFTYAALSKSLREYFKSCGVVLAVLSGLMFLGALLFMPLFKLFHSVFFQPGSWVFPPGSPILVLFPIGYFFGVYLAIGVLSLISGIVIVVLSRKIK